MKKELRWKAECIWVLKDSCKRPQLPQICMQVLAFKIIAEQAHHRFLA